MHNIFTRRQAIGYAAAAASFPLIQTAVANPAPVLVELFTSQGCSSCPPADRLAGDLRASGKVEVVSLNVDYWDYLGWRDTLARKEFTQRQYDYARARGDGQVYTPQMVINGNAHVVGSQAQAVDGAIAKSQPAGVRLEMSSDNAEVRVMIPDAAPDGEATLWLMGVAPDVSVEIERGENAGKTIVYHGVVRALLPMGMWKSQGQEFTMPREAVLQAGVTKVLAVLQKDYVGPILGLQRLKVPTS
jgi:hypothetical protein